MWLFRAAFFNDATNPVRIHGFPDPPGDDIARQNHSYGAKRPCLPWKGVAERSESFKIMIAGGNHSTVKRWLSVSETGGVCPSTERFEITPQSAHSGCQLPQRWSRGRFAPTGSQHLQGVVSKSAYFATLSCWIIRFMASMPTRTAPEVSSVIFMNRPAFSRS